MSQLLPITGKKKNFAKKLEGLRARKMAKDTLQILKNLSDLVHFLIQVGIGGSSPPN